MKTPTGIFDLGLTLHNYFFRLFITDVWPDHRKRMASAGLWAVCGRNPKFVDVWVDSRKGIYLR
jgi:hypothetical protein